MFLGTVNGAEALAVGVLHIARDALVTAIGGATDITVKVVSVATGAARGAVGATARVGGEVLGLATAAAQAAAGTGNRVAKGARVQQREEHDRSQSATGEGRRGKPWRRSRRVRSLARRRVRAVGKNRGRSRLELPSDRDRRTGATTSSRRFQFRITLGAMSIAVRQQGRVASRPW